NELTHPGTTGVYGLTQQVRASFGRPDHPEQHTDGRRLAGSVQADKPVDFTPPHLQGEILDDEIIALDSIAEPVTRHSGPDDPQNCRTDRVNPVERSIHSLPIA